MVVLLEMAELVQADEIDEILRQAHGNLAWRALKPVVPVGDENPYAVRVVSDILESNGSSSMASVCAGTLALMDSGLKIKKPVAGIAMGFIDDPENHRHVVLTDILGDEDHLGDMDFKVTGTKDGITATQMDIKVDGMETIDLLENFLNPPSSMRPITVPDMEPFWGTVAKMPP